MPDLPDDLEPLDVPPELLAQRRATFDLAPPLGCDWPPDAIARLVGAELPVRGRGPALIVGALVGPDGHAVLEVVFEQPWER